MWHLKTKLGTFWLIETHGVDYTDDASAAASFFLGIDDRELGIYTDTDTAAKDVFNQETGFFKWDSQATVKVPSELQQWQQGEPADWLNETTDQL